MAVPESQSPVQFSVHFSVARTYKCIFQLLVKTRFNLTSISRGKQFADVLNLRHSLSVSSLLVKDNRSKEWKAWNGGRYVWRKTCHHNAM